MADYRFARQPTWIAGHLLAVTLLVLFVNLGFWQLRRLDERQATNALVVARAQLPPEPVGDLLDPGSDDADAVRFRAVRASGRYDRTDAGTTVVRSTQDGRSGGRVFSVLDLGGGEAVVVLRGFAGLERDGSPIEPPPPEGEVDVVGIAFPRRRLESLTRQAIDDLPGQERLLPVIVQVGATDVDHEALVAVPPPSLGEGPHLSYAVQWFLFAGVGAVGYPILLRKRARG